MAIDSRDKRSSSLLEGIFPLADSTISTSDDQHALWFYRGISALAVVGGPYCIEAKGAFSSGSTESVGFSPGAAEIAANC